jgi:Xaa-Pro aminopeptidase
MMQSLPSEVIDRLVEVMNAEGWDCVLASSPESVQYLSGALIHTQTLMRRRQCAVLVTRDASSTLIVAEVEKGLAARMSRLPRLETYRELTESACIAAVGLLRQYGRLPRIVGVEKTHLPVIDFDVLAKSLPEATFVGADSQLAKLRMLKSSNEIEIVSQAASAMDGAILAAIGQAAEGDSEEGVAAFISQHVQTAGGGKVRSATGLLASGANLHVSHHVANATALRARDVMRIGCRSTFDGYHGLVARTAVVGECSDSVRDHYSRLHQAHTKLLESLQPGVIASQVYEEAASVRKALGLVLGTVHVGHGMGLEFHEVPKLAPGSSEPLQAGMTMLTISVSDDPIAGHLYIEDMVLIEERGPRLLSDVCDTTSPLRIATSASPGRPGSG